MYSKNNKLPNKIWIFHKGGLGDWLLLNPVIQEIKKHSLDTKIYIFGDKNLRYLVKNERNINGYFISNDPSLFKNIRYDDKIILSNFHSFIHLTSCKQHYTNLVLKIFNLDSYNLKPKIYLNQNDDKFGRSYAKLFKNRMIILCNDTSEPFKKWDTKCWERVIKECTNYTFIQVGTNLNSRPINGALNMLSRTTLAQAMSLVKYSKLVVAIEGFFNHVANAFNIPRVILWGNNHPRNFGYNNNTINIWKRINCSPCMLKGHPSQECIRESVINKKVPQCMLAIEEFEVINAIKKILKEKHDPNIKYYKFKPTDRNACLDCKHNNICNIEFFKIRFSDLIILQLVDLPPKKWTQ